MTDSASTSTPLPTLLMQDFDLAVKGQADHDPYEILHAILGDVLDSVRLAIADLPVMGSATEEIGRKRNAVSEVEDYIANHYGAG